MTIKNYEFSGRTMTGELWYFKIPLEETGLSKEEAIELSQQLIQLCRTYVQKTGTKQEEFRKIYRDLI